MSTAGPGEPSHLLPEIEPPLKFPYSLVWTPIPILTWLCPVIGHIGVCSSDGTIYDFAGSQYVDVGSLSFGKPTKYWQLDPADAAAVISKYQTTNPENLARPWDEALQEARRYFQQQNYSFFMNNCHSFAGYFLSDVKYGSHARWNVILVAAEMLRYGKYVGILGFLKTWACFAILMLVAAYTLSASFAVFWVCSVALISLGLYLRSCYVVQDAPALLRASTF